MRAGAHSDHSLTTAWPCTYLGNGQTLKQDLDESPAGCGRIPPYRPNHQYALTPTPAPK